EEGLYVVGMKSYGRAPTFLTTTGNEQVRSVVAALAGDLAAADDVRLVLPETGVCSVNAAGVDEGAGCCASDCDTTDAAEDLVAVAVGQLPAEAHRDLPAGLHSRGFVTGVAGGGLLVAEAVRITATSQST